MPRRQAKLISDKVWHTYAGGTFAAPDKYSYDAYTTVGRYMINPVSSETDSDKHLGYVVYFLNELGKLPGGLWQTLDRLTTLVNARLLCQNHMTEHNGNLIQEQIPHGR